MTSEPDRRDPRAVAEEYVRALDESDAETVCDVIDPELVGTGEDAAGCEEGVAAELADPTESVDFGQVESVERRGDSARVNFDGGYLDLSRQGGA